MTGSFNLLRPPLPPVIEIGALRLIPDVGPDPILPALRSDTEGGVGCEKLCVLFLQEHARQKKAISETQAQLTLKNPEKAPKPTGQNLQGRVAFQGLFPSKGRKTHLLDREVLSEMLGLRHLTQRAPRMRTSEHFR